MTDLDFDDIGEVLLSAKDIKRKFGGPYFGYATRDDRTIYLSKDLPRLAMENIRWHELYHIADPNWEISSVRKRELDAIWFSGKKCFWGLMLVILLSLKPTRLLFTIKRFL